MRERSRAARPFTNSPTRQFTNFTGSSYQSLYFVPSSAVPSKVV